MTVPNAAATAQGTPNAAAGASNASPATANPPAPSAPAGAPAVEKPPVAGAANPPGQTPAATKPGEGKAPEGAPAESGKPPAGAPAELKLKLPEGTLLDPKDVEGLAEYAKANGLSEKQAQGILDLQSKGVTAFVERNKAIMTEAVNHWGKELGAKYGAELAKKSELGRRLIEARSPKLLEHIDKTGWGQFPPFFEFIDGIVQDLKVGEDSIHTPSAHQPPRPKSDAEVFYPHMKKG